MKTSANLRLLEGYIDAKCCVVNAGYQEDIDWAEGLASIKPTLHYAFREHGWVVVNSGFRYAVARKLWPRIYEAFEDFDLDSVNDSCLEKALQVLNHSGKMGAVLKMAKLLRTEGLEQVLKDAQNPPKLTRLPWIGKITCWHYAKVLGADVIKPDVHLQRAAEAAGFEKAIDLARVLQEGTGDRLTVIDSVLWRYGEQQKVQNWASWEKLFSV